MRRAWLFALTATAAGCTAMAGLDDLRFQAATGGDGGRGVGGSGGSGGGPPANLPTRFEDRVAGDFAAGSLEGTRIDGNQVTMDEGLASATFRSRVFDARRPVRVSTVSWLPAAPYGKPLPREGGVETGYPRGGVDLSDAILLLDFEDTDSFSDGTEILNHAPDGQSAVVVGMSGNTAPGRAGQGYGDTTDVQLEVSVGPNSPFQFGTGDFTWAYWVNSSQECPPDNPPSGNRVHLGIEETISDKTHMWLGCTSSPTICPGPGGHAGGTLRLTDGQSRGYCGKAIINDGQWHHVALVKTGHDNATLRLYVDGLPDLEQEVELVAEASFEGIVPFFVGGFTDTVYQAEGVFDDVVVATRAWTAAEVESAYGRHAMGLTLRVRTCREADCADDPPFGPPLRDDGPEGQAPVTRPVDGAPGRYVQYEVELTAENALRPLFGEVILQLVE